MEEGNPRRVSRPSSLIEGRETVDQRLFSSLFELTSCLVFASRISNLEQGTVHYRDLYPPEVETGVGKHHPFKISECESWKEKKEVRCS